MFLFALLGDPQKVVHIFLFDEIEKKIWVNKISNVLMYVLKEFSMLSRWRKLSKGFFFTQNSPFGEWEKFEEVVFIISLCRIVENKAL